MALQIGDRAPTFELPVAGGGTISSRALAGTPFVLYFYPRDNTPGCTREAQGFAAAISGFETLGVPVIGVSRDSAASHEKFALKHGLNFTLAADTETAIAQAYGVWVKKNLYGTTSQGVERTTFLIDGKGVIRQVWRKVKVDGHAAAVLEAARALCREGD